MSTIKVQVLTIGDVRPHTNADALELATISGWQAVVKKGQYSTGDTVVYFEQGTVLPREVADRFGVTGYLSEKTDANGDKVLVVHRVKLRGEPSFGLVMQPDSSEWAIGQDVADHYGAVKYYPPFKASAGDADEDHPQFPAYTDIENMRSYPDVIEVGETVVATEKIHGSSGRVAFVRQDNGSMLRMAGSRSLRRREPASPELYATNLYWYPWSLEPVRRLMDHLYLMGAQQAVIYGEVYGKGVQSYQYGRTDIGFRAYDLMVNGQYVDYADFAGSCERFGVERCPNVYLGPFSLATIAALSDGESLIGGTHGREGVVVRPVRERSTPQIGRVILKYVGDNYLFSKTAQKEDTTDR
jgi:RNA ligase (TIGR02306 family)